MNEYSIENVPSSGEEARALLKLTSGAVPGKPGKSAASTFLKHLVQLQERLQKQILEQYEDLLSRDEYPIHERKVHLKPRTQERPSSESDEETLRRVQQERDTLRVENELLKSRVAEQRRAVARETRRYDQLLQELTKLREQGDDLISYAGRRTHALDTTASLLLQQTSCQVKMVEVLEGLVEHVHGDSVTVVFDVDDDVWEHIYRRDQFVDGRLPSQGENLTVCVHVLRGLLEGSQKDEADDFDEWEGYEPKKVKGPIEF